MHTDRSWLVRMTAFCLVAACVVIGGCAGSKEPVQPAAPTNPPDTQVGAEMPEDVLQAFWKKIGQKDYQAAASMYTQAFRQKVQGQDSTETVGKIFKIYESVTVDRIEQIPGDDADHPAYVVFLQATVVPDPPTMGGSPEVRYFTMAREDGRWLIADVATTP